MESGGWVFGIETGEDGLRLGMEIRGESRSQTLYLIRVSGKAEQEEEREGRGQGNEFCSRFERDLRNSFTRIPRETRE